MERKKKIRRPRARLKDIQNFLKMVEKQNSKKYRKITEHNSMASVQYKEGGYLFSFAGFKTQR
jgi:hypothetical protein